MYLDIDAVIAGYTSGISTNSLAQQFGVGRSTILDRLRKAGVTIRSASEWQEKSIGLASDKLEQLVEVVDGLMLGDGNLSRSGGLRIDQSNIRRGWIEDIKMRLNELGVQSIIDNVNRPARTRRDGHLLPPYSGCALRTPAYAELQRMHARWYPCGIKRVPDDVRITPVSVAGWVSGDGTGTKVGGLVLCTDSFTIREVNFLVRRLRDVFNIHPRRVLSHPRVAIYRKDDVLRLRDILIPHMSECCHYKFQNARPAQKRGKLSEVDVRAVRKDYKSGVLLAVLAARYGLSRSAVNNIGMEKVYKWVV